MKKTVHNPLFKGKDVIFVAVHHIKEAIVLSVDNLLAIIKSRPNTILVILDSGANAAIKSYLKTINHERVFKQIFDNVGKAAVTNSFIAENIGPDNLPRSVWSVDPDVLFDPLSFDLLAEAVQNLDRIGMLGMRYKQNCCNPEIYLFFPPKNLVGDNGKTYSVIFPFMANVAGPVFAIKGELLQEELHFRFFPVKVEKSYDRADDAILYDKLKWRGYRSGYLNGTLAIHLRSGKLQAPELIDFIKNQ